MSPRPSHRHPGPITAAEAAVIERELAALIAAARPGPVLPPASDAELLERLVAEQQQTPAEV